MAQPGLLSGLGPAVLLVLTGTGLLHTTVRSDVYLRYVKEGLRPYLVASGFLLVALGLAGLGVELVRRVRQPLDEHTEEHTQGTTGTGTTITGTRTGEPRTSPGFSPCPPSP
ncbi:hypothetical protein AB0940_01530 [Streptomyces sp. NPDC006656]|uniref:hypothetical protein n=1 Tax=Streptomyces sp. NPDC006656 TaxID=3156899 RepID=UPI0034521ADB